MESVLLKWFSNLSKESVGEAGGKGASLGEMTKAGIPVPNGYVILASSFEKFLESTDLNVEIDSILEKVNHKEMQSIESASEEIQALIMNAKMPKDIEKEIVISFKKLDSVFVAVRSSATSEDSSSAAWAGQLDSFLNTKSDTLLENVKRCWASLFTPRAIFYRFEKGLHDAKISVAVVVQKMVNSEISGIAFSVHPVTQDRNQLIIEAGLGLGEAIVSGQITPDSYVIEKVPRRIIDKNISEQERGLFKVETGGSEWKENLPRGKEQKLSDKQIMELAEIILGIEKHYGFPCDIEWAFEGGKFFIVQSRPITTLTDKSNDKEMPSVVKAKESEKKAEVEVKSTKKEENDLTWAKNYLESNEFDIKEARFAIPVVEIIFSVYAKPNCLGDEYGPVFVPYSNQKGKQILHLENYKNLERHSWIEAIKNRKKFIKVLKGATKIQKKINSIAVPIDKLCKLNQKKLHSYYKSLVKLSLAWWEYGSIAEDKGLVVEEKLVPLIMKNHAVSKETAFEYVSDMTTPLEISIFSKERMNFLDLCIKVKKNPKLIEKRDKKFFKELNKYSKNYFYARTSFYEALTLNEGNLVKLIKDTIEKNSFESLKDEFTKFSIGIKHLKEKQKEYKKLFTPTKEEKDYLWYFTIMHSWQDERKVSMMTHFNYFCELLREVSNRTKVDYDTVALMTLEEVESLILGKKLGIKSIESRKEGLFFVYKNNKVLRFFGEDAKSLVESIPSAVKSMDLIRGAVACKGKGGKVRGKVRIVHNPAKDVFNEGEVLVTTMTRPEFVPIMQKALAIVTNEGGLTSHAAIVSRELGIPCVIGTKVATQILKNGDLVEVDAEKGIVKKISEKNDSAVSDLKKNDNGFGKLNNYYLVDGKEKDKLIADAKKIKWKYWLNRPYTVFWATTFWKGVNSKYFSRAGFEGLGADSNLYQFPDIYVDEDFHKKGAVFIENYFKNHKMSDLSKMLFELHKDHLNKLKQIVEDKNKSISQKTLESSELIRDYIPYLWITIPLEEYFNKRIVAEVPKYIKGDYSKFIGDVSIPKKKNAYVLMQDELRKQTPLEEVQKKFGWIKSRDGFTDFYTVDELKEIKEKLSDSVSPSVNVPKELANLVDELKELTFFRADRTDKFYEYFGIARPFLKEIAEYIGVEFKELAEYDANSIILGKPIKYSQNFNYISINNDYCLESEEKFIDFSALISNEVKGIVAFKGKARGAVKIVTHPNDVKKVNEGDILVSQMTLPSFISAMQKASAFVTDEGSITCHAAIIAREMKKPCITGTKNATKVLCDGDYVEVDAEKGIVRIISKSSENTLLGRIEYKKVYSRNFSVLRMQFLSDGAYYSIKELTNGKYYFTPLFIKSSDEVVNAYYDFSSPEQDPKKILSYLNENIPFVKEKFSEIKIVCAKVNEIIKKNDFSKARFVFDSVKKVQPFSTLGKLIGEVPNPPKDLFDIFAGFRFDYDGLMYRAEKFLLDSANKKGFDDADYLTFEEIFEGIEAKNLLERKKGFVFFRGEIVLLEDKDEFLNKNNIIIKDQDFGKTSDFSLKKVEKSISRDLPLSNSYVWHYGYSEGMLKELEWRYSDTIFYQHEGHVDIIRDPNEQNVLFKEFVYSKIKSSKDWFSALSKRYSDLLNEADDFYKKNNSIDKKSNKKIAKILLEYNLLIGKIMGPFIVMYWIPNWFEKESDLKKEIGIAIKYRKASEDIFPKGDELVRKILGRVENELKLEKGLKNFISYSELLNFLTKGVLPDNNLLVKRKEGIIFSNASLMAVNEDNLDVELAKLGYYYERISQDKVSQIKGQSAFRGKVCGKVKIILNKHEIKNFPQGCVLVSSMTTPEYVPAMNKAIAFVTDEGGVTCHAAIVSRELKVPCIVGAKIATKVLNNGDLVEVDANSGIVKILEKSKK